MLLELGVYFIKWLHVDDGQHIFALQIQFRALSSLERMADDQG